MLSFRYGHESSEVGRVSASTFDWVAVRGWTVVACLRVRTQDVDFRRAMLGLVYMRVDGRCFVRQLLVLLSLLLVSIWLFQTLFLAIAIAILM